MSWIKSFIRLWRAKARGDIHTVWQSPKPQSWIGARGQATLELALTLPLVITLIMGILELGVAFNAYNTLTSAAREGARSGAIYLYDSTLSQSDNDTARAAAVRAAVVANMGILKTASPYFDSSSDISIRYVHDPSLPNLDTREGDLVTVQVVYQYQPLSALLNNGSGMTMRAEAQARIE